MSWRVLVSSWRIHTLSWRPGYIERRKAVPICIHIRWLGMGFYSLSLYIEFFKSWLLKPSTLHGQQSTILVSLMQISPTVRAVTCKRWGSVWVHLYSADSVRPLGLRLPLAYVIILEIHVFLSHRTIAFTLTIFCKYFWLYKWCIIKYSICMKRVSWCRN